MAHRARKRFGQNFLHDPSIIQRILSSLQLSAHQHWVEIGPGKGALTGPLLNEKVNLDVVELDRDLVIFLNKRFKHVDNLVIHSADALSFDFSALASDHKPLRIIGNLPYNISTPLMFHLLNYAEYIEDMYFMLQKEMVDRICALPGSKKYGRLSVMMQYHCTADYLFAVEPESFDPRPRVMSAIVKLTPHAEPPVSVNDIGLLNELVAQAFSQRRKTIRNSLSKFLFEQEITALGINPGLRAEDLSLEDFATLSNATKKTTLCD